MPQVENLLLFLGRMGSHCSFSTLYIYTPEVYPTSVRATAMGSHNSFGRLGGIIAPAVAVEMVEVRRRHAPRPPRPPHGSPLEPAAAVETVAVRAKCTH